jgi:uncharacterized protein
VIFEFDKQKSDSNKLKHGIDFVEAQALWDDPDRLELPARSVTEKRFTLIAQLAGKHWLAVFTPRGGNVRIISVRRARTEEVESYES